MAHTLRTALVFGVLVSLIGLSACSPAAPTVTPTLDLNPFRTEVAATVFAQVSEAVALTPSATLMPSPTATLTLAPTATQATATIAPSPEAIVFSSGTPVINNNRAEWVSQSIQDGAVFAPNETFTITWRLRNAGTTIWTTGYALRYYTGNQFGAPAEIALGRDVPPGETVDITIPMTAPALAGDYRTDWVMADEARYNFNQPIFLKISVAVPATPTRTATTAPPSPTP